jgi:hypothetical protein
VAFSASASNIEQESDELSVAFSEPLTNIGEGFDTSGTFQAPVEGVYYFHDTTRANGNGAAPLLLYKGDDSILSTGRSDGSSVGPYPVGSDSTVVAMAAGESVQLKIKARPGGFFSNLINSVASSPTDVTFIGYKLSGCGESTQQVQEPRIQGPF